MSKVVGDRKLGTRVSSLDGKLAGYLAAAGGIGALLAKDADAAIVANTAVQPFGINGVVNIDFNNDTQIDFQIDHDRVNLNGTNLDYLQIDKNDINGEANPLDTDPGIWSTFPTTYYHYTPFPLNQSSHRNDDAMVLSFTNEFGDKGGYAVGLRGRVGDTPGDMIGGTGTDGLSLIPGAIWDFQEGAGCFGIGYCRANRLIDEDHGQIDENAGRSVLVPFGPQPEYPGLDDFTGLSPTDVRYLGVRLDLNDAGYPGNPFSNANAPTLDDPANYWYGWIGIRITNQADATGEVVGYAYETVKGMPIEAGDVGTPAGMPGDYNGDTVVDGLDYAMWRNHLNEANETNINNNGDGGDIGESDFTHWKLHYGDGSGPGGGGSAAIPEPSSFIIGCVVLLGGFLCDRFFGRRGR